MSSMNHDTGQLNGRRSPEPRTITIAEVMTTAPHTIGADQKLTRAHDVMRQHGLRHLPVLDGGKLVGVLSQRDLYFVEAIGGVDARVDSGAEAMAGDLYTVAPGDCVRDVARTMGLNKYGCAVVVDRGHVVGIFTATDALALLAKAMS
jgi:acetoin utilization protein AcuB